MKILSRSERGQALVLIILAIIGIFGFSALAIDGGMVYAERRRAQNAADAAVMAGTLHMTQSGIAYASNPTGWASAFSVAEAKALSQATTNGFTSDIATGGATSVTFLSPPTAPAPAEYIGDRSYYMVIITSEVAPMFSQFVFNGRLRYTVWAIAQGLNRRPFAGGNAIFATSDKLGYCQSLWFTGTGGTEILGGNVTSNNPTNSPQGNCYSGIQGGGGVVLLEDPFDVRLVGGWNSGGSGGVFGGDVITGISPLEVPILPEPGCSQFTTVQTIPKNHSKPTYTIGPGRWDSVRWGTGDGTLYLKPGLYCITNGFIVNGGALESVDIMAPNKKDVAVKEGVFFYIQSGDFSTSGNAIVKLNRPDDLVDALNPTMNWGGYLLYMPYENNGLVIFGGGGNSTYSGTIYAPGPPKQQSQTKCIVEGNSGNIGLASQIVCYSVKVGGTGSVYITYDENSNGYVPASLDLKN